MKVRLLMASAAATALIGGGAAAQEVSPSLGPPERSTDLKVILPGIERAEVVADSAGAPFEFRVEYKDGRRERMTADEFAAAARFAALRDGPVGGVDEGKLLVEDGEGRVLLLGDDAGSWRLPSFAAAEAASVGLAMPP